MSRLDIFRDEEFVTEKVLMRASVSLGRHPENDIVLDDRTLSRFHARVERRGDRYVVIDLGAQNGVYLNGTRIVGESHLSPGDRIGVGRYVAIFDRPNAGKGRTRRERRSPSGVVELETGAGTVTNAELDIDSVDEISAVIPPPADDFGFEDGTTNVNKQEGPVFVLLYNGLEVSRYPVEGEMVIGRSKNSDIVISLLGLSRRHAKITVADDAVLVEDMSSQNGTWVNHVQVEGRRALQHGDLLNFYEYGLLYLEDASADVSMAGAEFSKDESGDSALEIQETGRRGAPTMQHKARPPTEKSPVPLIDSDESNPLPPGDGAGLDAFGAGALFPEVEDEDEQDRTNTSPVGDEFSSSSMSFNSELDEGLKRELESFSGADFADDDSYVDRTAHSLRVQDPVAGKRGAWPTEKELDEALRKRVKPDLVVLEVTLDQKPYTQMPLTLPVTRIGTDARCELALPKGAGLASWQVTLANFKGCVVCYRASPNARVLLDDTPIDQAVLKNGDELVLGRVRITLRVK